MIFRDPANHHRSATEKVALYESLSLEVFKGLFVIHVALGIFELFFEVPCACALPLQKRLMKCESVIYLCYLVEVLVVGDAERPHPVDVPPLLEVPLKGAAAPVGRVAADLALELLVEAMELVQPVGDRLAVPAQRQLEGVVDVLVLLVAVFIEFLLLRLLQLHLELVVRPRLLLLDVGNCVVDDRAEHLHHEQHAALEPSRLPRRRALLLALLLREGGRRRRAFGK
mmetsp:Transcript_43186/g.102478  ORF Transcript_43186/g.102478 Transcript_43186/m.102478 type:complete len:227 (-) Transcript_43186:974-1654(-)